MWRPKLIALDLDGTLLDAEHRLSNRSQAAVLRAQAMGATLLLCTGRPSRMTAPFAEQLGLRQSIVYNGAALVDHEADTHVLHHVLDPELALRVVARLREGAQGIALGIETPQGWFVDEAILELKRKRTDTRNMSPPDGVGRVEEFLAGGAIKVFGRHPAHPVERLGALLAGLPVYVTWSGPLLLEVMHPAVNKRDALERYIQPLGITPAEVAAFGDNHNDVQMLAWAGRGIAPANATPEAQAAADEGTASHTEDGVAQVLERWFA